MARPNPMTDPAPTHPTDDLHVELIAVLTAINDDGPAVLTIGGGQRLPSGPFEQAHRSLQTGLRRWVEHLTGHRPGYIEQLYTFADRDRLAPQASQRAISISYLGLMRADATAHEGAAQWGGWYDYFPWEDHRAGPPAMLTGALAPRLRGWAGDEPEAGARVAALFGLDGQPWNEEWVLPRYELLYQAGLITEAGGADPVPGRAMFADHRRILATAMARLRAKIKYRPVVFELMPPAFTLLQLQRAVEALSGRLVHKQNFRRLIEQQELVEETGAMAQATGGRPAKLFRFRPAIETERMRQGTRPPVIRA